MSMNTPPTSGAGGPSIPFIGGKMKAEFAQLDVDLGQEEVDDQAMLALFLKRPPAEDPGVDISAITKVDPQFVDADFIGIARDTFDVVKRARSEQQADLGTAELGPDLEAELRKEVSSDVAAHRRHVESLVEIEDAKIIKAEVHDTAHFITVRFSLSGGENDLDLQTGTIMEEQGWENNREEDWTFVRTWGTNTDAQDRAMTLNTEQWFIAHKGWTVSHIVRVNAPTQDLF